ncbi:TetR/AcrR family transcriptional regulator [Rathayibacter sp. CAU 1779]
MRERILEACIDAFGESGFHGTTMKDIARRSGISYTGLLHHFPSKEDLLLAVLELRAQRDQIFLEQAGALNAQENPLAVFDGMLRIMINNELHPGLLELHAVLSGEATSPEHPAHDHYIAHYRNLRDFYATAFAALAQRSLLASTFAAEELAVMTVSLLNGVQAQWLFDRDRVDMERTLRRFLGSIIPALEDSESGVSSGHLAHATPTPDEASMIGPTSSS